MTDRTEAMDNLIAQDADLIDTNDKDSAVLLPCPFCGGVQIEAFHHIDRGWGASWHVECVAEECGNSTCHHDTEATAIAAWNKRQPTQSDNNFHKLALSESFERVAKVAEEREAFNEAMAAKATAALKDSTCPIHAAKLYLQGTGPWELDEIGVGPDDSLVQAFARHRQHAYDHGYYDGRTYEMCQPQTDALKKARDAINGLLDITSEYNLDSEQAGRAFAALHEIGAALEQSK